MADAESSSASDPKKNSGGLMILGVIAFFFAIIGSCAAYFLWPRGERVGAIDLRGETLTLSTEVGPGDKLNFRVDTITVGTTSAYGDSSRSRTNKVQAELKASVMTVTAVTADGASKLSTECGLFADKATTGSTETDSVTSTGLPLDCLLEVEKGGVYKLTAKIAWVPKDVRAGILEVRREKASK